MEMASSDRQEVLVLVLFSGCGGRAAGVLDAMGSGMCVSQSAADAVLGRFAFLEGFWNVGVGVLNVEDGEGELCFCMAFLCNCPGPLVDWKRQKRVEVLSLGFASSLA